MTSWCCCITVQSGCWIVVWPILCSGLFWQSPSRCTLLFFLMTFS